MLKYNVKSSGYKTSDAAIAATGAKLHGIILLSDASNAASVVVYDNASAASGTKVGFMTVPASTTAPNSIIFNYPIMCSNGIYADVTGTGATYIILYSLGD